MVADPQATSGSYRRQVRVRYPAGHGRIVVRTELDWERDVEPAATEDDGASWLFELSHDRPFLYFKPCLHGEQGLVWAAGPNLLATLTANGPQDAYPYFHASPQGGFAPVDHFDSACLGRDHRLRVYLPPGYDENTLKRYPVIYMQDARNLFFPDEAFGEKEWRVDETVAALDAMSLIDRLIVVGVYSDRREEEYTLPGYEAYGRAVTSEVKPRVDGQFRTLTDRDHTLVMGSSLGGVAAFHMGWRHPDVFRAAACMSSTFGWRDDLLERVRTEPRPDAYFYLDSGWPNDNYEATMTMALALIERGFRFGRDFMHLVFPEGRHDEASWGARLHLPLQLFAGKVRLAAWAARKGAS